MQNAIPKLLRTMPPVELQSSSLAHVAYDRRRAILEVEFRDGATYRYTGVPLRAYRDLLQADSKGAYFNHHIRSRFPHSLLSAATPITSG